MRQVIIYLLMAFLSLLVIGFGGWTYTQSVYSNSIRKAFIEKNNTPLKNLKEVSLMSDKNIIVSGKILATETFSDRNGNKVVLERYKEERDTPKGWKDIKDTSFFKVVPFKIKEGDVSIIIDPFGLDKTYIGEAVSKIEIINNEKIKKSLWTLSPGQEITVLGNVENKSGTIIINNPNLYNSFLESSFNKIPFIITTMKKTEAANKASEIARSIYYSSIALFAVGIFFIFTSLGNAFKHYKQDQNNF